MTYADKVQHAVLCAAAAMAVVLLDWLARRHGLHWAVFAGGSAVAWAYEGVQAWRKEGQPSALDALAGTAAAALVACLVYETRIQGWAL
jgi:hypothetical protein